MSKRGRNARCVSGDRDGRGTTLLCAGILLLLGRASLAYAQPSLSVSPTAQTVLGGGGTLTAQVTAGAAWTASTNASWITLNTTSGTGSGPLQYQVAANPSGNPQQVGTVTVTSQGLQATVTVTEAALVSGSPTVALTNTLTNGSLPSQATQTLTFTIGDPNGPGYLNNISIWIDNSDNVDSGLYACQMGYQPQYNAFYFASAGGPVDYTLGGQGQVATGPHCIVNAGNSSMIQNPSSSTASVTLNLMLTLQPSALGTQNIYVYVTDGSNNYNSNYWNTLASWTPFPLLTTNPPTASMDPAPLPTSSSSQVLHYEFSDGNGFTFLNQIAGQLAPNGNGQNSPCYFYFYFPNMISLYQIANGTETMLGTGTLGGGWSYPETNGIIGGQGGLAGPGTCSIDLNQSTVYTNTSTYTMDDPNSGTPWPHPNLYLNLWTGLDTTAQSTLPLNIYLAPTDLLGQGSQAQVGTWSVPSLSVSPTSQQFLGGGGTGTAAVTVSNNASWTATGNVSWITFNGNGSNSATGSGAGPLQYQVAMNPSGNPQRIGTITVTSQGFQATVTVTEAAFVSGAPTAALTNTLTNGSLPSQATQTLNFTGGDPNGPGYIDFVEILVNDAFPDDGYYACQMWYYPQSNVFYFANMSSFSEVTLGTPGVVSGAHCSLDTGNSSIVINPSSSTAGVTLNLALTLQPSALGSQNVYAVVADEAYNANSNYWNTLASWTAFPLLTANPPTASMDPAPLPTSSSSQVLDYEFSDGNGYTFLNQISGQLAPNANGLNSPCYFSFYFPNLILLYQVANGTETMLGEGYIGGGWSYPETNGIIGGQGGLAGPGTCSIDLNQSQVYTNTSTYTMDDPNSGTPWPHTNLYLNLWTGLDTTAQSTLPLNIYLTPLDLLWQGSQAQVGTWSNVITETITTSPSTFSGAAGQLTVDGNTCTVPCVETWAPGSQHTVQASVGYAPLGGTTGYSFSNWSDGGANPHTVTAAAGTLTAYYTTQYYLTTAANPASEGSISPTSGWYNANTPVPITASPGNGYMFSGFSGALSGTSSPQSVTMAGPATVTANFQNAPDFSIAVTQPSPATVTVLPTQSAGYTIGVGALYGFTGTVSLSVSGLPSGATAAFSPATVSGSGTASLAIGANIGAVGNYIFTVVATSGSLTHTTTAQLSVQDFTWTISPTFETVANGGTGTYTISVAGLNGFSQTVWLQQPSAFVYNGQPWTNLPTNASFQPSNTVQPTAQQPNVTATMYVGPFNLGLYPQWSNCYSLCLNGAGYLHCSPPAESICLQANGSPTFYLSVAGPQTISPGGNATYNVNVVQGPNFTGTVNLGASGLPSGFGVGLSPASINTQGVSTLTVSIPLGAQVGTWPITVTGVCPASSCGTQISQTATTTLVVAGTDFTINAVPASPPQTSPNISPGGTATYAITVNPINGYSGTVTLSNWQPPAGVTATLTPTASPTQAGTLTVSTSASLTPGVYYIPLSATDGTRTRATPAFLCIEAEDDGDPGCGFGPPGGGGAPRPYIGSVQAHAGGLVVKVMGSNLGDPESSILNLGGLPCGWDDGDTWSENEVDATCSDGIQAGTYSAQVTVCYGDDDPETEGECYDSNLYQFTVAVPAPEPPTITGNQRIWYLGAASQNDNCVPNSAPPSCYYNWTTLTVVPGAGGSPPTDNSPATWSLTDPLTGQAPTFASMACVDSPCSQINVTATTQPTYCRTSGNVQVRLTLGGVPSAPFSVVADWPQVTNPYGEVDTSSPGATPGYISTNALQLASGCGNVMQNIAWHEEFPAGWSACTNSEGQTVSQGWTAPIPQQSWGYGLTDENGLLFSADPQNPNFDGVGYACAAPACSPASTIPGPMQTPPQPLSTAADAWTYQFIFVGSQDTVNLGKYWPTENKQVRYTDHGVDQLGTWSCPSR